MIDIFSIEFFDRFNGTPAFNLRGCIGSYVKARIKFYLHWEVVNTEMQFNGKQIILGKNASWLNAGFLPGDKIRVVGSGVNEGEYIIDSVDDQHLLITGGPFNSTTVTCSVYGISIPNAVKFMYNTVENDEPDTFFSRLDNKAVMAYILQNSAEFATASTYNLQPLYNTKHWITGSPADQAVTITRITGTAGVGYLQDSYYQIEHTFYVTPTVITDWLDANDKLDISLSDQYSDAKSPRYTFKIEMATDNQNFRLSTDGENIKKYLAKGAVGWWGEEGNSLPSKFSVDSVEYREDTSGNNVSSLLSNAVTRVKVVLKCVSPAAFTNNASQRVDLYFAEKVADTVYTNPANDLFTNFNVSYATKTIPGAATVFNNISDYKVTFNSATQVTVEFKYAITGSSNKYALWVETQSGAKTDLKATDKVALLIDEGQLEGYYNLDGVVTTKMRFLEHPFVQASDGTTDYKGWIEDGVLLIGDVQVLKKNTTGDDTALSNIVLSIVAENGVDGRSFVLETMTMPIGLNTVRNFKLPTGDPKLEVSLTEEVAQETPSSKYFTLKYAYKERFEEWLPQSNADSYFIGKDNKKWNNYSEYINSGNWNLKIYADHNITVGAGVNSGTGIVRVIGSHYVLNYEQYDACPVIGEIKCIEETTGFDLTPFLSKTNNTRVQATFTGNGLDCYNFANTDFYGILEIYEYRSGTIESIRQISTLFNPETDTPWIGLNGNMARLVKSSGPFTVVLDAILNMSFVDPAKTYTITARLGKITPIQTETCTCPAGFTYDEDSGNCFKEVSEQPNPLSEGWVFGGEAGVTFKTLDVNGDPTPFTTALLNSPFATAVACDNNGNIIVYTDGEVAWSGTNAVVSNVLKGKKTASQGAMIIRDKVTTTKFWFATLPDLSTDDCPRFHIYDSTTETFIVVNQPIISAATRAAEKQTMYTSANGDRFWIARSRNSNDYIVVPFTASGFGVPSMQPGPSYPAVNLSVVVDSSSNGFTGQTVGLPLPALITSPFSGFNKALEFDGINRGINDDSQGVKITGSGTGIQGNYTVEAKIRTNNTALTGVIVAKNGNSGSFDTNFRFDLQAGKLRFYVRTSINFQIVSNATLAFNTKYDVAVSYDGTTIRMFINGVLDNSALCDNPRVPDLVTPLYIGKTAETSVDVFNGAIDEVRGSTICRYTANYTPSTVPFENDADTQWLYHLDFPNAANIGVLKSNNNGYLIDTAYTDKAYLLPFNETTKTIGVAVPLPSAGAKVYGAEFSSNKNVLYVATTDFANPSAVNEINQFDLTAGSIDGSVENIFANTDRLGQMQIGPNNVIYIAAFGANTLYKIQDPNVLGVGCGFAYTGPSLAGKLSTYGLPNYDRITTQGVTRLEFPCACVCPDGYVYNAETNQCENETGSETPVVCGTMEPTVTGVTYTGAPGNHNPNERGASIMPDEIDGNFTGFEGLKSAFWKNRYFGGIWTTTPQVPTCEYIGFSFCLNGDDGDYIIGFTVDDICRITVNGVILGQDSIPLSECRGTEVYTKQKFGIPPTTQGDDYFNFYRLPLVSGQNTIKVEMLNAVSGSASGLSFDIAGPYPVGSCITAAGLYAQLNHDINGVPQNFTNKIISSHTDFIGQPFVTGEKSGYTCGDGYVLSICDGVPVCKKYCIGLDVVPCEGQVEGCQLPETDISSVCPAGNISINMIATKGRTWIVTDDFGTTPMNITTNGNYLFGAYGGSDVVTLTLTDSIRPNCKITQVININCT